MTEVTRILSAIEQSDAHAAQQLLPLVYEELRKLAAQKLAHEKPGQTLQGTALVHEAYLRLVDTDKVSQWNSRGHFFAAAAEAMRRILIEGARSKARESAAATGSASISRNSTWRPPSPPTNRKRSHADNRRYYLSMSEARSKKCQDPLSARRRRSL